MRNDGKKEIKLKSREELLAIMNEHFETQQRFAEELRDSAQAYINKDELTTEDQKKRNSLLHAYNQQVDAVSRTTKTMINIYNSSLNEEDEEDGSLLD